MTQSIQKNIVQQDLTEKMQNVAQMIGKEGLKYYSPAASQQDKTSNNKAAVAAMNIICLHAMRFKQDNSFGFIGNIRLVKRIRRQLQALQYSAEFVNNTSIALIQALFRMQKKA
jgi:hypothetical protein